MSLILTDPGRRAAVGLAPPPIRVLAPPTAGRALTEAGRVRSHAVRGACHVQPPSTRPGPAAAARWSATHPWRAIGGWLVFVAVAVGLAIAIPTADDHRRRLPARRVRPGRRHSSTTAGLAAPDSENVLITAARRRRPRRGRPRTRGRRELARRLQHRRRRRRVTPPVWSPDRSALLVEVLLARRPDDAAALQAGHRATSATTTRTCSVRQAGDVSVDDAINDRVAEDLGSRRGHQPAGHPGPHAAGLRRPDRGRHPGAAGRHQRRGHHRHLRAHVPPGPRRAHRQPA